MKLHHFLAPIIAVGLVASLAARVDVKVEYDKTFDFKPVRTWAWNSSGPGEVKMARTKDDDPEAARKRAEPIIVDAVGHEMSRRGLVAATNVPDVAITYYLLLTTNQNTQTMGQFLPSTMQWGIPVFAPATQSLQVMNHGSLVLDISSKGTVIWRGVARADIKMDADEKKRERLIREGVRDLLQRFPPKS